MSHVRTMLQPAVLGFLPKKVIFLSGPFCPTVMFRCILAADRRGRA